MNGDGMGNRIKELLEAISKNDKYNGCVFWGRGIYFVIGNGKLWEIPNDVGGTPRGGWFPDIVKGPSAEEAECLAAMMEAMEFDEDFFRELIEDCGEFDECLAMLCGGNEMQYYGEIPDSPMLKNYRRLAAELAPELPFHTSCPDLSRPGERNHGPWNYRDHDFWNGHFRQLASEVGCNAMPELDSHYGGRKRHCRG